MPRCRVAGAREGPGVLCDGALLQGQARDRPGSESRAGAAAPPWQRAELLCAWGQVGSHLCFAVASPMKLETELGEKRRAGRLNTNL